MKNAQIILLIFIFAAIAVLVSSMGSLATYETVGTARKTPGKYVHVIARLDRTHPIEYDAVKDPNYLSFMVVDSLGERVKVVYHSAEPESFEMSDRIVLEGTIKNDYFDCDRILLKCPSKYSDDPETSGQHLPSVAGTTQP